MASTYTTAPRPQPPSAAAAGRWARGFDDTPSRWRGLRHPLRIAVMTASVLALTWSLVGGLGAVPAAFGAAFGVVAGELLGRGKLRLAVLLPGAAIALGLCLLLARVITRAELVAEWVGPGTALMLSAILRFGAGAMFPVLALRALAVRRPSMVALELFAVTSGLAALFAAHRGGVISRPFWLADWAWRAGVDPAHVLLAIGGAAVLLLAILMVAETGKRISWLSLLVMPALAGLILMVFRVTDLPKPSPDNDLGLTESSDKETQHEGQSTDTTPTGAASSASGEGKTPPPEGSGEPPPAGSSSPDEGQAGGASSQERAPVAVVLLGDDYSPPLQMYYFRQEIFSHYNGSRFVSAERPDADLDGVADFPSPDPRTAAEPPATERKRISATVALLIEHKRPFGLESPVLFEALRNPNPQRFVRAYRFESLALAVPYERLIGRQAGDPAWSDDLRAYYLVPSKEPRFAELAQQITAELPADKRADPFIRALAVKLWMDKALTYSTSERHANVPDPTADFLFGNRIGYCVHFAHAAVFLWRSLGIPARVAAGYATTEDDREGSSILIESSKAHAWPELYLEGVGWTVLDISPEKNLDPQAPGADKDLQRRLAELARAKSPDGDDPEPPAPSRWPSFWWVIGAALGLALLVLYAIKLWRRLAPRFAKGRAMTRVGYRLALDWLSEAGFSREYGETREAFARRVAAEAPAFAELTRMHVAAYWADPATPPEQRQELDVQRWRDTLAALARELRGVGKPTTRWINLMNPASFAWSR